METEVGGGIRMGNTCKPMAVSFQCMTKFTTNKKKKDDVVKLLYSICQKIWRTQWWPTQDWKRSIFIPIPKKGNAKECLALYNCAHFTCYQYYAQNPSS